MNTTKTLLVGLSVVVLSGAFRECWVWGVRQDEEDSRVTQEVRAAGARWANYLQLHVNTDTFSCERSGSVLFVNDRSVPHNCSVINHDGVTIPLFCNINGCWTRPVAARYLP